MALEDDQIEILVVEDNPSDLELTLHALRLNNLVNSVQVARDGQEALDYLFRTDGLGQGRPKLILLDLKLPLVDGMEVLRQIKDDPETRVIPVVVLTSSREERDLVESYQLGVNSYIQKPVDFAQFSDAVRQIGFYWLLLNHAPA
jgi:two-component system response regulator